MLSKLIRLVEKLLKKLSNPLPPLAKYHFAPWAAQNELIKKRGDSCYDISYAGTTKVLKSGHIELFETGLFVELPENYEIQVRSRSGIASKNGIFVLNSPGTVDEIYRGEIKIILANFGANDFVVERGMRIAQLFFHRCDEVTLEKADQISQETDRGSKGFGSSGLH